MKKESPHIWVKTPIDLSKVQIDTILFCTTESGKVIIHQNENCELTVVNTLIEIENMLPASSFCRCHKSYLINLCYVKKYCEKTLEAVLINDIRVPVARDRKDDFLDKLLSA